VIPTSEETRKKLQEVLPPAAALGNPVDVIGDADPERYIHAFTILQEDDQIDAIVVVVTPQNMTQPSVLADRLVEVHKKTKPLLTVFTMIRWWYCVILKSLEHTNKRLQYGSSLASICV